MELTNIKGNTSAQIFFHLSNDYCIKGTILADEGNLEEALDNFTKAVEADPTNHIAYFNRATIKVDIGDIEGARNDFYNFDKLKK
jgi:Flp pilus assembly protein TadD